MPIFGSNTGHRTSLRPFLGFLGSVLNYDLWGVTLNLTLVNSWTLTSATFNLANYVTGGLAAPTGTLTATVYNSLGTYPTGAAIASGTRSQSELPTLTTEQETYAANGIFLSFEFSPSVTFTPSANISIILTASQYTHSSPNASGTIIYQNNNVTGDLAYGGAVSGQLIKYGRFHPILPDTWSINGGTPYGGSNLLFELTGTEIIPRDPERPDADTITFPSTRPDAYNPDQIWDPGQWVGDVYTDPEWAAPGAGRYFATGGGRWNQQLVVCGNGQVYYEAL
jgi:hypothetical protein